MSTADKIVTLVMVVVFSFVCSGVLVLIQVYLDGRMKRWSFHRTLWLIDLILFVIIFGVIWIRG